MFLTIGVMAHSQESIIKEIEQFRSSLLRSFERNNFLELTKYDIDTAKLSIIPSFYYKSNEKLSGDFFLNDTIWDIVSIGRKSKDIVWLQSYSFANSGISKKQMLDSLDLFEIKSSSKFCFFIYFIKTEPLYKRLLGYYSNGRIQIIDYHGNKFDTLDNAIKYYWGSLEKLNELNEIEKDKEYFSRNTSIDEAKNILRKSYNEASRLFPNDTVFLLNTFLNEIGERVNLFDGQRDYLQRLILKNSKIKVNQQKKNSELEYFLNNIVSFEIINTLTKDQYSRYRLNGYYFNQKVFLSKSLLFDNYKYNLKKPPKDFDNYLKEEVFSK